MGKGVKCASTVMTASGLMAIEKIKVGDRVLSADAETMQTGYKSVLETYIREVDKLIHLTVNGEEIVTTRPSVLCKGSIIMLQGFEDAFVDALARTISLALELLENNKKTDILLISVLALNGIILQIYIILILLEKICLNFSINRLWMML